LEPATLLNSPIHFIHGSIPFVDLCALYALADIGLVTPLIDGMNLAKEFIACQRENAGVLILSEFAGAAEELFNALLVNPYDSAPVAGTQRKIIKGSPLPEFWSKTIITKWPCVPAMTSLTRACLNSVARAC
jgi:trehalose 6-phosphate synthase/phosphatase